MKLKSYFSGTVEAAMDLARQELGEEALLVNARPATLETRHLGAYEVVFGVPGGATAGRLVDTSAPSSVPDRLIDDVADLKREIERMASALRGAHMMAAPSETADLAARLTAQELDGTLIEAVARGRSLEDLFEVDSEPGRKGATRKVIALVGPPGAGKTTTLVKLAARYGLASRRPSQILSTDVYRIAAADQLRSLAAILGIGCQICETPVALAQALEEHRNRDFVFVDTPGLAPSEMEDGADLARLLATHPEIDTHLALPASMRTADLSKTADRYQAFQPKKLLFTRVDETGSYGALVSESVRRRLPISFLTTGQSIPDDIEPATKRRLAGMILGAPPARARSIGASA